MKKHKSSAACLLLFGLLLHAALAPAAAATKWVFFVYMLADNDLEQFGLMDMEVSRCNKKARRYRSWQHAPAVATQPEHLLSLMPEEAHFIACRVMVLAMLPLLHIC
jgi:hypothetical protein